MKALAGLFLGTFSAFAADTFVLHGLTNVTLGQAVYGSNVYHTPSFINLRTNGEDGVSIHLGEADSGIFVYPAVIDDTPTGAFMVGNLFGNVNGESNRMICSMRCHEAGDGVHPVEIDFSPLGASLLTYQAFDRGALVAQSPPQSGPMVAYGNYFNPLQPRVNPFWRMPDGSVGALIEFILLEEYSGANVYVPGIGDVRADRLFIRVDEATNVVDFASRLDIYGGGRLEWFDIYDARLGVFRKAHMAFPDTLLEAHNGRLTLRAEDTNASPGVAIELEQAGKFDATFVPISFETNAALAITGIGIGSGGPGESFGSVAVERQGDSIALAADIILTGNTNTRTIVYNQGIEVARRSGSFALLPATARIAGCGLQTRSIDVPPGISIRVDQAVSVVLEDQVSYQGDEVHFVASDSAIFAALETMTLTASNVESFTIINEVAQPPARPRLNIERRPDAVLLSWVDPNRVFRLESAYELAGPFYDTGILTEYDGGSTSVLLEVDASSRFLRLSISPRQIPPEEN